MQTLRLHMYFGNFRTVSTGKMTSREQLHLDLAMHVCHSLDFSDLHSLALPSMVNMLHGLSTIAEVRKERLFGNHQPERGVLLLQLASSAAFASKLVGSDKNLQLIFPIPRPNRMPIHGILSFTSA